MTPLTEIPRTFLVIGLQPEDGVGAASHDVHVVRWFRVELAGLPDRPRLLDPLVLKAAAMDARTEQSLDVVGAVVRPQDLDRLLHGA